MKVHQLPMPRCNCLNADGQTKKKHKLSVRHSNPAALQAVHLKKVLIKNFNGEPLIEMRWQNNYFL